MSPAFPPHDLRNRGLMRPEHVANHFVPQPLLGQPAYLHDLIAREFRLPVFLAARSQFGVEKEIMSMRLGVGTVVQSSGSASLRASVSHVVGRRPEE